MSTTRDALQFLAGEMSPQSMQFMRRTIELAIENVPAGGGPFGAVIARDGKIIAEGTNRVTSTNDPTAHAEIVAIREACRALGKFQLSGCEIYVSCEPCPMCLGAIYWARLERVYYGCTAADAAKVGFDDSVFYRELHSAPEARRIPMVPMMREEALTAFRAWNENPNKISY